MPVPVSYPGVYVQEVPSGVRTITGVSTSVALFIGMTRGGRLKKPKQILSLADYERAFGTGTAAGEMTEQVRQSFLNGGQQAWVTRNSHNAKEASVHLLDVTRTQRALTITAKDAGGDGELIRVEVDYDTPSPESTFNVTVFREVHSPEGKVIVESTPERFTNLSMNTTDGRFVETFVNQQSTLIDVEQVVNNANQPLIPPLGGYSISGILFRETSDVAADSIQEISGGNIIVEGGKACLPRGNEGQSV